MTTKNTQVTSTKKDSTKATKKVTKPTETEKTAKKAKKTTSRKTTKQTKKKVFKKAPEHHRFHLMSGPVLSHYIELADALAGMEEQVIKHHVTSERHDFANWIRDVFDDKELADIVMHLHSRQEIRLAIYQHLVNKHLY
jgi:hypothetical protein